MSKNISTVIQEMKHHRKDFMKKSTPYRQLTRAIKQLEKLKKIEQIVNSWDGSIVLSANDWKYISEIKEILEDE